MPPGQVPREPRIPIGSKVSVEVDGRSRSATLLDISPGGAKLQFDQHLEVGEVLLDLPDMPGLKGEIRWTDGSRVGLAFEDTITFRDLAGWIERHQLRLSRTTLGTMAMITACSALPCQAAPAASRASLSVGATVVDSCIVSSRKSGDEAASIFCSGTTRFALAASTEPERFTPSGQTSQSAPSQHQKTSWITITY